MPPNDQGAMPRFGERTISQGGLGSQGGQSSLAEWKVDKNGEEAEKIDLIVEKPGWDPRWDAGAEDWSDVRNKNMVFGGDGGIEMLKTGYGEHDFAVAVEDEPLLDEDALRLNAVGLDVTS